MSTRDELLTPAEVANWLHVKEQTLAVWRSRKAGPKTQPVGRRIFYRASDVQSYLDALQAVAS